MVFLSLAHYERMIHNKFYRESRVETALVVLLSSFPARAYYTLLHSTSSCDEQRQTQITCWIPGEEKNRKIRDVKGGVSRLHLLFQQFFLSLAVIRVMTSGAASTASVLLVLSLADK